MRPLAPSAFVRPGHRRRLVTLLLALLLVASACSGDDANVGERGVGGPRPAPTIAGEVVDGFAPGVNDRVAIIGVASGETMSMRALPGDDQPVIAEIPATTDDLFGFGQAFQTPDGSLWWLVRFGEAQGWIEPGAAYLGAPADVSVNVAGRLESTTYDSFDALVDDVRGQYGGDDAIVVAVADETDVGDVSATLDVLSGGDDSIAGTRVIVNANSATGSYRLTGAQEVPLCARGVNDSGICQ